jgi:NADPH:quinone reductase-like Zn-dependent oxidoreductase/SAM-dependent methyltransferase
MIPLSVEYKQLLIAEIKSFERKEPQSTTAFFSSVTPKQRITSSLDASYWATNLTSPVRFSSAISELLTVQGDGVFLEIGPHSTLEGPLRQICAAKSRPFKYVPALTRKKDCRTSFLSAVGKLFQEGTVLDLRPLFPKGKAISGLPTYSWDHSKSYWHENRISKAWRHRQYPHHCLLGARVLEGTETEPQWRNILELAEEPWLADHKIYHDAVFPFAGYVALAGEAVRQLTHSSHDVGYRLRHVVANAGLVLSDSAPTELITSLRHHKLNDKEDSEWFDFSVTSYNGSVWVKHCDGQVSLAKGVRSSNWTSEILPRAVNCSQIYDSLAKVGFVYGPEFRGLANVTSSTTEEQAIGQVVNRSQQSNGPFTMHPAAIDACLQLLLVAQANGLGRNIAEPSVPTTIEELEIGPGRDVMDVRAWNLYGNNDFSRVEGIADGKVVLHASGIEFHPLGDEENPAAVDVHACSRLEWLPDFDFVDMSTLFEPPKSDRTETRMQEELTLLCILETAEKVRYLQPCQPHFARFRDWLNQQIGFAMAGRYKLVDNCEQYTKLSHTERRTMIEKLTTALLELPQKVFTVGLGRILDNAESIFVGDADTLDILLQDNILARIYDVMSFSCAKFVRLLAHTRPTLRILEVGAGTGGNTEAILSSLPDVGGLPFYSTYTFTDISAGFFAAAKERFARASNMEFKVFDITKDPGEQGIQQESYDLIVAANVIHATPSLQKSLSNLRSLLKPEGMLMMTELCSLSRSSNYVFGNFAGWWLGEADGRPDQPYVSVSRWDEDLKAVGFSGVDMAVYDDEEPYQHFAVIVSKKQPLQTTKLSKVTILTNNPEGAVARMVAASVKNVGCEVAHCGNFGDDLAQDQDVVSCLDLELNFFENIPEEKFAAFQYFVGSMGSRRLLWLTSPLQVNCRDPRSAQTIGVARTVRSELGCHFYTLEIDSKEEQFESLVGEVFHKIRAEEDKDDLESDKEFIVDNGVICVGRYRPFSLVNEVQLKSSKAQTSTVMRKSLNIGKPGMLETLTWRASPATESIPEGHVEIDVRSAGLNFHDVVYAMGLISSKRSSVPLGKDVSGTVRRLGSGVRGLAVGDRIMAFVPEGGFSTQLVVADNRVLKIPDGMGFEEAATIPCCFSTVAYALLDCGRLRKGMSVLIHSACGGVGLTAIQVTKMMGGEIFATVGNEKKVEYLVREYNIPRNRIFSSRDPSFLEGVMQQTGGRGVDLVLNSLPGELLRASWKCVAKNGTMLELGKRDLESCGQLDLSRFLDNRSYCGIDVAYLIREEPLIVRE